MRSIFRGDPTRYGLFASAVALAVVLLSIEFAWLTSRNHPSQVVAGPIAATSLVPNGGGSEPAPPEGATTTSTAAPATTAAPAPSTTHAAPVTKPAPKVVRAAAVPTGRSDISAYTGLGTWSDVFEWSMKYTNGHPKMTPAAIDAMADQGVQTWFVQAARVDWDGGGDIVEPDLLNQFLARARARHVRVVPWYLPTTENSDYDLRRMVAMAKLPEVGTIGVDIESTKVSNPDERSRRIVDLSVRLRAALPDMPLSAITLPNVATDVINRNYWPRFPWLALAPLYDVWQPMDYWTNRKSDTPYRNAEKYTLDNINLLRGQLKLPNAPVSPIGGIADKTTVADIEGFRRAVVATHSIGGSMYTWSTQQPDSYAAMRPLRS